VFQKLFAGKIPAPSFPWFTLFLARSRTGAFATAVLFTIGKSLIGVAPYGAAGALIILTFVHVLSCPELVGAELAKAIAPTGGRPPTAKLTEEQFTKARVRS
jgi:membrane protein